MNCWPEDTRFGGLIRVQNKRQELLWGHPRSRGSIDVAFKARIECVFVDDLASRFMTVAVLIALIKAGKSPFPNEVTTILPESASHCDLPQRARGDRRGSGCSACNRCPERGRWSP